ncbi:hypothetical protein GCM10007966_19040 [Legionella impletisoli]|uniref:Uncharacterized protein n=1 Tax=Legionella impletisoli TaxID=343510 RepID=A0A917JX28_9GAMM|nr:hypothetical protein GCM10007966_19040 [Legionella impletisoli]
MFRFFNMFLIIYSLYIIAGIFIYSSAYKEASERINAADENHKDQVVGFYMKLYGSVI